jgi:hypothetical protein
MSILDLIKFGARWEDDSSNRQALRHFYNPLNDSPLDLPGVRTTFSVASPDWALEDSGEYSDLLERQNFSYRDARRYLVDALTSREKFSRDKAWGLTFQTLGHVIHHLQDMAQPQHVRNDPHCDQWISVTVVTCWHVRAITGRDEFFHPSRYESWARKHPPPDEWFADYPPVYPPSGDFAFGDPRQFWKTGGSDGKGIAEYTNRGFLTARTLSDPNFPEPTVDIASVEQMSAVCDEAQRNGRPACPWFVLDSDRISFYANEVRDSLDGSQTRMNPRAATRSLYDEDLLRLRLRPVFALNRFNFDAAYQFLLRRAVAYSAGLINYFFRGQMEISLPDDGVYGIVDHVKEGDPESGGFRTIKAKIRNVTSRAGPDGIPVVEPMLPGPATDASELIAIAKFYRNMCYTSDLSGEYNGSGSANEYRDECRSPEEEIVVSDPADVPEGINEAPTDVTFEFPSGKIPINAVDLYLQIVYLGPLGEEWNGIAVATHDIAEPYFGGSFDTEEQSLYGSETWEQFYCSSANPPIPYEQCKEEHARDVYLRFARADGPPVDPATLDESNSTVVIRNRPVSGYARFAFLVDQESVPVQRMYVKSVYRKYGTVSTSEAGNIPENITINQEDPVTGEFAATPYFEARGLFGVQALRDLLTNGDNPNPPPMGPIVESQVNF